MNQEDSYYDDSKLSCFQTNQVYRDQYLNEKEIQLPRAIPIADKPYSLEPDMIFGWTPKISFNVPIKLSFKHKTIDEIVNYYKNHPDLIYLGFRPNDSITLHKQFSQNYHFKFETILQNKRLAHLIPLIMKDESKRIFEGQNPNYQGEIYFNSIFEGGNLDLVIKVGEQEYDLFMRVDSNTRGHFSWYNFTIQGQGTIKLNIVNFTKSKCLYNRGMKPYIKENHQWRQGGRNVVFEQKELRYEFIELNRRYYCLSFELDLVGEEVQVAYCIPYSYSKMLQTIRELFDQQKWAKQKLLCQDLSGIDVPMINISEESDKKKKVIVVQARIHPGESNGSWMMHGFLEYIASQQAQLLRQNCILKIIPMLNPDGVILGNYRTGMAGRDLNREFIDPDETLYPCVNAIKNLIKTLRNNYESVFSFLDFHGHSVKKNVFLYGPEYSIFDINYYKCRILPKLLSDKTDMFRYYGCIFRISECKKSTARGVLSDDILHCFTIEASNGSYMQEGVGTFEFSCKDWIQMGYYIGECLSKLVSDTLDFEEYQEDREESKKIRDLQQKMQEEQKVQLLKQNEERIKEEIQRKRRLQSPFKILRRLQIQRQNFQKQHKHQSLQIQLSQENSIIDSVRSCTLQNIFEQVKQLEQGKQKRNESISEGGSDSESEQDDYSAKDLNKFKKDILQIKSMKQKKKRKCVSQKERPKKQSLIKVEQQAKSQQKSRMNFGMNRYRNEQIEKEEQQNRQRREYKMQQILYNNEINRPMTSQFKQGNNEKRLNSQEMISSYTGTPQQQVQSNNRELQRKLFFSQNNKEIITNPNQDLQYQQSQTSEYCINNSCRSMYQKDRKSKGSYPIAFHSIKRQINQRRKEAQQNAKCIISNPQNFFLKRF